MQVGDIVHFFKNINLLTQINTYTTVSNNYPTSSYNWFKDPSRGIVFKKFVGKIERIIPNGEVLSHQEMRKYCKENKLKINSFDRVNITKGDRFLVKFPEGYFLYFSEVSLKASENSMLGYVRIVPKSIDFILSEN